MTAADRGEREKKGDCEREMVEVERERGELTE